MHSNPFSTLSHLCFECNTLICVCENSHESNSTIYSTCNINSERHKYPKRKDSGRNINSIESSSSSNSDTHAWKDQSFSSKTRQSISILFHNETSNSNGSDVCTSGLIKRGLRKENLNVCHLLPKFDEISLLLKGPCTLDIMGLCETFLNNQVCNNVLKADLSSYKPPPYLF